MTSRSETLERILEGGVVAVLRGVTDETLEPIATALADGGITAVEVTADTDDVLGKIERLAAVLANRPTVVGAGTVLDAPTARATLLAGADFIVTPTLSEPVIETANREAAPVIPGVMTPTEVQRALEAGTDVVKLFPASTVGPGHLSAIHGPLEQVSIIPTGGVDLENAADFIDAGSVGVGVGSSLVTDEILADSDWDALEARASDFVAAVANARD